MKKQHESKSDLLGRDDVRALVAERAYFMAESEGFPLGREMVHWLAAEEQILREMADDANSAIVRTDGRTARSGAKGNGKAVSKPVARQTPKKPAAKAKR